MADTSIIAGGRAPGNPSIYNPLARANMLVGTPVATIDTGEPGVFGAGASSDDTPFAIGLLTNVGVTGNHTLMQTAGFMELSTADWDAITGQTGGLTQGAPYYLRSASSHPMGTTPLAGAGTFTVKLGIAISATEFFVQIGDVVENT
jgi:hypothetical protein